MPPAFLATLHTCPCPRPLHARMPVPRNGCVPLGCQPSDPFFRNVLPDPCDKTLLLYHTASSRAEQYYCEKCLLTSLFTGLLSIALPLSQGSTREPTALSR